MINVSADFHSVCKEDSVKTRIRIYFIDDSVDCSDDADVAANGTLLRYNPNDTDSNQRINISQSPVIFTEYYNPNDNKEIGRCVSNTVSMTLLNDDGALSAFQFGRCKIYLDLYVNGAWESVPMGVYLVDTPQKRMVSNIVVSAYDQMRKFDEDATTWWASLDFSGGLSFYDIVVSMCAAVGVSCTSASEIALCNNAYTFSTAPFAVSEQTYRDVLAKLCEANAVNAMFNRDGVLNLSYFEAASYGYSADDGIFSFDQSEYVVENITAVSAKTTDSDVGYFVGDGNAYLIINNPFLNAMPDSATTESCCGNILAVLGAAALDYTPITFTAVGDWSLQAGDVVDVDFRGSTYSTPIMQQSLSWGGSGVRATVVAKGTQQMPSVATKAVREQFSNARIVHDLQVTVDELLTRISNLSGDYSEILQTVGNISSTVSTLSSTVSVLQSDTNVLMTFKQTATEAIDGAVDDLSTINAHITFTVENGKPVIILATDADSDITQKIYNDALNILVGANINTHIDSNGINTINITVENGVQIGNDASGNWLWHKTETGHLVLDLI